MERRARILSNAKTGINLPPFAKANFNMTYDNNQSLHGQSENIETLTTPIADNMIIQYPLASNDQTNEDTEDNQFVETFPKSSKTNMENIEISSEITHDQNMPGVSLGDTETTRDRQLSTTRTSPFKNHSATTTNDIDQEQSDKDFSPDDSGDEYCPEKTKRTRNRSSSSSSSNSSSSSSSSSTSSKSNDSVVSQSLLAQTNDPVIIEQCNDSEPLRSTDTIQEGVLPAVVSNITTPNNESSSIIDHGDLTINRKKRVRNEKEWKKYKAKRLKNSGKQYVSRTGKIMSAKSMKPPCSDKCRYSCTKNFSEQERSSIFDMYWGLCSLQRQRDFLNSTITVLLPVQRRLKVGAKNRKPNTYYSLTNNGTSHRVCKTFLLNTLDISERTLRTIIENRTKDNSLGNAPIDKRGKHGNQSKTDREILDSVRDHINSIPRIESHYLRAHTTREYIDGGLSIAELHRDYKIMREAINKTAANYDTYFRIFNNEYNISFFVPKKEQCDLCQSFKNALGEEKEKLREKYEEHQRQKELSREEKKNDIARALADNNTIVAIYDLQAVMPVPIGDSSSFFYKSKLNCLNLTITDIKNKNTICFFWHEGLGNRCAVEIGSCVFKFLQEMADKHPDSDIILYSDNCCGQQKNRFVFAIYAYAVATLRIKSITHKFLIRGHTQNEGDTAHSIIERAIKRSRKSGPIYVPDQYVQIIRSAKKSGNSFDVRELNYTDFYDVIKLADKIGMNTVTDNDGNAIKTGDVKVIQFRKHCDTYRFKTNYENVWKDAQIKTRARSSRHGQDINTINLEAAYNSKFPISQTKQNGIKELFKNNIIPSYYKSFYDTVFSTQ